jgi:hypothetical protein
MIEDAVREALVEELKRQAEIRPDKLKVSSKGDELNVQGDIRLDELVMAVMGSVAGGP